MENFTKYFRNVLAVGVSVMMMFVGDVWGQGCINSSGPDVNIHAPNNSVPTFIGLTNTGTFAEINSLIIGKNYRVTLSNHELITISKEDSTVITFGNGIV